MSRRRYEMERARLAGLTRAARFEELLDFPCQHMFKVIGDPAELANNVRAVLAEWEHPDAVLVERPSSRGRWLSISVEIRVQSGEEVAGIYKALEQLPGVAFLF